MNILEYSDIFEKFSDDFVEYIKQYESDTFSSSAEKVTDDEVSQLVMFFLLRFLNGGKSPDKDGIDVVTGIGNSIDGVELSEVLGWIRDEREETEQAEIKKEIEKEGQDVI